MLPQFEREARLRAIQEVANSTSLPVDSEIAIAEASIRTIANSEDIRLDHFERLYQLLSATPRASSRSPDQACFKPAERMRGFFVRPN